MNAGGVPLLLVSLGEPIAWLPELAAALERCLPVAVRLGGALPVRPEHAAGEEGADADALLDALVDDTDPPDGGWVLGVTEVDLVAAGRPFVFGEAEVAGRCALVGTARLGGSGEGGKFLLRVTKEAVHELGHIAGLAHCPDAGCVMSASSRAADVDRKGDRFCGPCAEALRNLLGSPIA